MAASWCTLLFFIALIAVAAGQQGVLTTDISQNGTTQTLTIALTPHGRTGKAPAEHAAEGAQGPPAPQAPADKPPPPPFAPPPAPSDDVVSDGVQAVNSYLQPPLAALSPRDGSSGGGDDGYVLDAAGSLEPPRGSYDTLPRGEAYDPSDYISMPTVTLMQGTNIWPLPDEYVELVLLQFNRTLEQYPHNLTYEEAYKITTSQASGRRLLADAQDNVGVNVTVTAPSANASDVADLLRTSASNGALQQAIAAAGGNVSAVNIIVVNQDTSSHSSSSVAGIVGGVVGGIAGVLVVGLLGFWWVRRKRRAASLDSKERLDSERSLDKPTPRQPSEKRTEDSAEDLGLEGRHASKLQGRSGWPLDTHLLVNSGHGFPQNGPLIPVGDATRPGDEELLARLHAGTTIALAGDTPTTAISIGDPGLERFDSVEEQARAALMNGGISDPSTTPSSSDSSQGECCSICQAEQDICPPALATASPAESRLNLARNLWQVDYKDLDVQDQIGEGSFGRVYLAKWRETTVAVKVLAGAAPSPDDGEEEQRQHRRLLDSLEKEASMMAQMRHPNVVLYLGLCLEPPCVVTEYCARGSLSDVLKRAANNSTMASQLDWSRRLNMALDAAKGMHYLHQSNPPVIHRDLKSPNLLVDRHWRVRVCDFNLSRVMEQTAVLSSMAASNPRWLAPEILGGRGYTFSSDVYSFGIILWELITWRLPWHDCGPWQVVALVTEGHQRPDVPTREASRGTGFEGYDAYCSLMRDCWAQEATDRPTFEEVIVRMRKLLEEELGRRQHSVRAMAQRAAAQ
ncbi:hypothetical protein WJX73_000289 [Symbiochloris irregularis]|uniref:Protein kinase domain-containing protein n=1 Tax=Symbiochloris irregularis TaxID=706552 RepID=A0AAW1PYG7_9CHLO